ncbi:MAG: UspA domain protein [Hyphomicrobiales bacterium]|jgi:nucleotide-binding universal stress UspA family protein|nr:UspA domain protein [Hyphomicrobiales bacterium]
MFKHILVSTDGSALSDDAIEQGVAIAKAFGARLSAITVTVPFHVISIDPVMITDTAPLYEEDMRKRANEALAIVSAEAQKHGLTCEPIHREAEHPWWAIIDTAKAEGCDLIVMSSHGRGGFSAVILGSQTLKVLANSGVPVLVSRPLFANSP